MFDIRTTLEKVRSPEGQKAIVATAKESGQRRDAILKESKPPLEKLAKPFFPIPHPR